MCIVRVLRLSKYSDLVLKEKGIKKVDKTGFTLIALNLSRALPSIALGFPHFLLLLYFLFRDHILLKHMKTKGGKPQMSTFEKN